MSEQVGDVAYEPDEKKEVNYVQARQAGWTFNSRNTFRVGEVVLVARQNKQLTYGTVKRVTSNGYQVQFCAADADLVLDQVAAQIGKRGTVPAAAASLFII